MPQISSFDEQTLRAICDVLGDTDNGLSGAEIGSILYDCRIADTSPTITKRHRLYEALSNRQSEDRCGNNVVAFIRQSMGPVRYVHNRHLFETRRETLNQVLFFAGLMLGEDGQLERTDAARTISQARERTTRLRRALLERQVHSDVLLFCREELLQDNYFHAVFEATKSIADKIREKSGLVSDGAPLVDEAFGGKLPLLAFNTLQTETEQSEQKGLMNLLKGLFGTFRNTTAHAPKIKWTINEQDALDMLSLTSLLHRKLDGAVRAKFTP